MGEGYQLLKFTIRIVEVHMIHFHYICQNIPVGNGFYYITAPIAIAKAADVLYIYTRCFRVSQLSHQTTQTDLAVPVTIHFGNVPLKGGPSLFPHTIHSSIVTFTHSILLLHILIHTLLPHTCTPHFFSIYLPMVISTPCLSYISQTHTMPKHLNKLSFSQVAHFYRSFCMFHALDQRHRSRMIELHYF